MKYENYENAIIEHLQLKGVDVSALPGMDVLNEPRQTTKPQVFVIYNGSDYASPETLGVISQVETLNFEVFIRSRKRRGNLGIFDLYEHVTKKLLGWKPTKARTQITFDKFGYVTGIQNNWQYALTFSFTSYIVESDNVNDEPTPPLIKQITNNLTTTE